MSPECERHQHTTCPRVLPAQGNVRCTCPCHRQVGVAPANG
jgi:hypothetical protein